MTNPSPLTYQRNFWMAHKIFVYGWPHAIKSHYATTTMGFTTLSHDAGIFPHWLLQRFPGSRLTLVTSINTCYSTHGFHLNWSSVHKKMASVNKIKKTVISQEEMTTERENYSKVILQKSMMFPTSKPNQISEKEIDIQDTSSR